ncbi:MAG: DEAD/DEAH box helicase family protein [Treponema sp.]|nr:DEAD/DEAH box helicase family protein [Treponema sp.]
MEISNYLSEEVRKEIKSAIEDAGGNEVFFTGTIDENGIVNSVKVGSRGNENTVPVNFNDERECAVLIHNHPGGNLLPSDADLNVASHSSEYGKGFYIINNDVTEVYIVVECVLPRKITKIDSEKTGSIISEGGELSKLSETFEERPTQVELIKNIVEAFNEEKIGVFEAGTGVGKSFAYLIPASIWALTNNDKIVISTGTINLQQQLCQKDIPFVEKILGQKIKYVLMKGRQNYICKRRLNDAQAVLDLFEDEKSEITNIKEWAETSATGSKSELTFQPSESAWSKVNSDSDVCMGARCPYHSECFVMKVRREASGANLIVVNHHLLFADIESRYSGAGYSDAVVLPPYRHIIFDEAHGIENAATSFFSESFTRFSINRILGQLYRKKKNSFSGFLCTIALLSSNEEKADEAAPLIDKIKNSIVNIEIAGKDLLQNEYTLRLCDSTARNFGPLFVALGELSRNLAEFADIVRIVMEGVSPDDKEIPAFWEAKSLLRRLDAIVILINNFPKWDEKRESVFWLQRKRLSGAMQKEGGDGEYIVFTQTPLEISKMMNGGIYEQMKTVVCTSATLKTGRSFDYWMGRCGINLCEKERVAAGEFDSPFPYNKNMLFAVPKDAPLPESPDFQQYIQMAISRLIRATNGRTLVLFTSYDSLKNAHNAVSSLLRDFDGRIMKQGDDDNARLLEAFKQENESVLFATDSFWQGVDVPGESLSQVIIVKLPFTVPNDPVFVARAEDITKKGGNSFMDLSVPEAVIKFRQGIGRLIRRSDDKGVVVVLDKRIVEKRYGANFIANVPDCKKMYSPLEDIVDEIKSFIF